MQLKTNIRGRHAASDNKIIVRDDTGKITGAINNLDTRISAETTEVAFSSACDGTVCLRLDDNKHADFWIEFNLDIPTLQMLLNKAKASVSLHGLLFPQLEDKTWAEVNLNDIALKYDQSEGRATADEEIHWIEALHDVLCVDYSWGGYLEHRAHLLRHHYNKDVGTDHFWHLGIDYNVPAGTEVHMPVDGVLVYAEQEKDQDGGWGGKLIFLCEDRKYEDALILGHLDKIVTEKRLYKQGEVVAVVGSSEVNGNWFPHLHVQCVKNLTDVHVDGYSHWYEGIKEDYPNPVEALL